MIRSELRWALRSSILPALIISACVLTAVAIYGTVKGLPANSTPSVLQADQVTENLVGLGFGGYLLSVVYGSYIGARDFGNQAVIRRSFLANGQGRLLLVKTVALSVPAILFGIVGAVAAVVTVDVTMRAYGLDFEWSPDTTKILMGVIVAIAVMTYIGMFVGWLCRRLTMAIVILVAYTVVIESALLGILPKICRFLPGGAISAITLDAGFSARLPMWGGYLTLIGWLVVLLGICLARSKYSDLG